MVLLLSVYLAVTLVLAVLLLIVVVVQRLARVRIRRPVEQRDVTVPTDQPPRALADHR